MTQTFDDIIFVPTKHSGNYTIYQKTKTWKKKIQLKINGVNFPFGKETYNDNIVINFKISDSSNYASNIIFYLTQLKDYFENLKISHNNFDIKNKDFFSFIKNNDQCEYHIRAYLKYGAKITHSKYVGTLDSSFDIKNKYGNYVLWAWNR